MSYQATVQATGAKGKGRFITFLPDGKPQPWTFNLFGPDVKLIYGINPGDRIEYTARKNDKGFWEFENISKVGGTSSPVTPPVQSSVPATPMKQYREEDPKKQKQIQRSVAVKAATEIICVMIEKDKFKKTADLDLIKGVFEETCAWLEPYLMGEVDWSIQPTTMREPGEEG